MKFVSILLLKNQAAKCALSSSAGKEIGFNCLHPHRTEAEGVKMKGFVRILEAIIASIILLTSLTFFFTSPPQADDWGKVILQNLGKDALAVADISGNLKPSVNNNNATTLTNFFSSFLPKSVAFSTEISEIPNPVIRIGCNCTASQITDLEGRLSPLNFVYKNRNISIRVENVSIAGVRNDTDTLFLFGYVNLNPYESTLKGFFQNGGTVFMLADLTEPFVNDSILNETFGLSWNNSLMQSGSGTLYQAGDARRVSWRIRKYYRNTTGSEPGVFASFHQGGGVNKINLGANTIVQDNNPFGGSLVKVNSGVENGNGRTVWFADYNSGNDALLKAAVMWASGESFMLDAQPQFPGRENAKVHLLVYDRDTYVATITVWNVFR